MPDVPTLGELEKRKAELLRSVGDLEKSSQLSKEIANLQKRAVDAKATTVENLNYGGEIGSLERLGRALSTFSHTNATYVASKAAQSGKYTPQQIADLELKTYLKDIRANLSSAITGRETRRTRAKTGTDLMTDIFGMKPGVKTTTAGIAYDIALGDPSAAVTGAISTTAKWVNNITKISQVIKTSKFGSIADDIPVIGRSIDKLGRTFDIFYDLDRSKLKPENVKAFKDAFRLMAFAGDDSALRAIGKEMPKGTSSRAWQNMVNLGNWGQGPGKLRDVLFPTIEAKILEEAFGKQPQYTNLISKGLNWTNSKFKSILAWNPKWHTRNVTDALIKNSAEGVDSVDYLKSLYMSMTHGNVSTGSGKVSWRDLVETGLTSSTGPMDVAKESIIGKITNWFETTFARVPVALHKLKTKEAKTVSEAAKFAEDIHYNYSRAYQTGVEKVITDLFMPYFKYEKGQVGYWPNSLMRKQRTWGGLYHARQNTEPEVYKDNPHLAPLWMDSSGIGAYRNLGTSLDDFAKTIFDFKEQLPTKVAVAAKAVVEAATDYSFFRKKPVSSYLEAKEYANVDPFMKYMIGFNENTKQANNPWMRWGLESALGPLVNFYTKATGAAAGEKSWSEAFFSPKPYEYSLDKLYYIKNQENKRNEGTGGLVGSGFDWLFNLFYGGGNKLVGPGTAGASPSPHNPVPVTIVPGDNKAYIDAKVNRDNAQTRKDWSKDHFGSTVSPDFAWNNAPRIITDANTRRNMKAYESYTTDVKTGETMMNAGTYSADQFAKGFLTKLNSELQFMKFQEQSPDKIARYAAEKTAEYERTRARGPGQYFFSSGELASTKTLGIEKVDIAFNKAQEELAQFASKTSSMFEKLMDKDSVADIIKLAGYEKEGARRQAAMMKGDPGDLISKRMEAIDATMVAAIEKLQRKAENALFKTFDGVADSMVDSVEKIQIKQKIAIQKWMTSDDYNKVVNLGPEAVSQAIANINAKYDEEIRKRQAVEAKTLAENLSKTFKDEATNTVQALQMIYERGGMSIDSYFKQVRDAQLKMTRESIEGYIQTFLAQMRTTKTMLQTPDTTELPFEKSYSGKVTGIEDGDTIYLTTANGQSKKLRFAGIDAPETEKTIQGVYQPGQPMGEESKKWLTDLLLGQMVDVEEQKRTSWGRSLGNIRLNGRNIQAESIEAGYAYPYLEYLDKITMNYYMGFAKKAMESQSGVWSLSQDQRIYPQSFRHGPQIDADSKMNAAITELETTGIPGVSQTVEVVDEQAVKFFNDLNDMIKNFDANAPTEQQIQKLTEIRDRMRQVIDLNLGDVTQLSDTETAVSDYLNGLINTVNDINEKIKQAREQVGKAYAELAKMNEQTVIEARATMTPNSLAGWMAQFSARKDARWNKDVPMEGTPQNPVQAEYDLKYEQHRESEAQKLSGLTKTLPGELDFGPAFREENPYETQEEYLARFNEKLQQYQAEEIALSEDSKKKLRALNQTYWAEELEGNRIVMEGDKAIAQQRVDIAMNMVSMLGQTAEILYQESGKQSKAMFYMMKAMKLAEVIMTGITTVSNAYDQGMKVGGQTLATAYASVATAFVAAQVAAILNATFAGPEKKAKGGLITGGSGTKDDVPVLAMGGEYVIQKDKVDKYGTGLLDAINSGIYDSYGKSFALPELPGSNVDPGLYSNTTQIDQRSGVNFGDINVAVGNKMNSALLRDELESVIRDTVKKYI